MRVTVGLGRLSTCPHQFELVQQYGTESSGRYSGAAYLGVCFHRAMEYYFTERMAGRKPALDDTLLAFTEEWEGKEALPSGVSWDSVVWTDARNSEYTAEQTYEDGLGMLNVYFPHAETLEPILAEEHWQVDADGLEIEGTIDLVCRASDDALKLVDFKTGRTTKSWVEADTSIQLSVYAWALRKLGVWKPLDEIVELHSVVRHARVYKNGRVNPEPYKYTVVPSRRNLVNYEWIDETYIPRLKELDAANIYPAYPGQHCFLCPVKQHCGHWESISLAKETADAD